MDTSMIISLLALLVAIASLVYTVLNGHIKSRIEIVEKTTELLKLLTEANIILEYMLRQIDEMYIEQKDVDPEFGKQLLSKKILLKNEQIELIDSFRKFEDYGNKFNPVKLEQLKLDLIRVIEIGKDNMDYFKQDNSSK